MNCSTKTNIYIFCLSFLSDQYIEKNLRPLTYHYKNSSMSNMLNKQYYRYIFGSHYAIVLKTKDKVIGWARVTIGRNTLSNTYPLDIFVKKSYRNKGFGTKIMNHAINFTKKHQCKVSLHPNDLVGEMFFRKFQ